ncbi:transglutaminase domain-containing protein [Pedobacter sp. MR2016-19]|uniref:discoidin domain-containing protein n=1 Tax=Pedobacter sp. MR2016-19 TaxID=2780089 RepID=UPI0018757ADE|nr:discoidin domain-containing protein [Pedobacter sp. MR2016-19]MBE5318712.1 transglutaminase domain-containing protein [Pedobacter sp. MR2016-19]
MSPFVNKYILYPFLVLICLVSCKSQNTDTDLEKALGIAGDNRVQLEKVLKRYSKSSSDSLKYKAAVFLIKNMPGYISYSGKNLVDYTSYFRALRQSKTEPVKILDSINAVYGGFKNNLNLTLTDIETLDSAYLCENIDYAFKAWTIFPWSKKYDFEQFCEYILPYRTDDEMTTSWRRTIFEKYLPLVRNIKTTDAIEVATILRDSLINRTGKPIFTMTRPRDYPALDALTSQYLAGSCDDLVQFTLSLFRTFGIACSKDYIPLQGAENVGHSWVSLTNDDGDYHLIDFFGEIVYVSEMIGNRTIMKTKVYRRKFSKNKEDYERLLSFGESIPYEFSENRYRFVDVTGLYSNNLTDLTITKKHTYEGFPHDRAVFLCAPSWLSWIPMDWSTFDENSNIHFKNIDAGSILRLAYFDGQYIKFITSPFIVNKQSRLPIFIQDTGKRNDLTLFNKFNVDKDIFFSNRMIGGIFEASNNTDFRDADTLYKITNSPKRLFTEINITSSKKYCFFRYKGGKNSYCNIAEVEFIPNNSMLKGVKIGSLGSYDNNKQYTYQAATDGLTETSFDHSSSDSGWVGIKFEKPLALKKIRYTPRNYDNYVKPGNDYELFISSDKGWKTLGRKKATSDSLFYKNVPINGLFYLKNHSAGQNERIFTIKKGKAVFK